ncbi:hypothetical protein MKX54_09405 [Alkalihalobacillus sp. FSL R5-0424]
MYLLNEAVRIKHGQVCKLSYVIKEGKVDYIKERMPYWNNWRVDSSSFVLAPSKVGFESSFLTSDQTMNRAQMERQWLKRGVTTLALTKAAHSERSLPEAFYRAHEQMLGSTLDYVIGMMIPLRLLKPSLLYQCRRLKIPFLQIMIEEDTLSQLPWSHLADALVSYQTMLLPHFSGQASKNRGIERKWKDYCTQYGISTTGIDEVWTKETLQKSGLYPTKGELLIGSDADYLLFHQHVEHYPTRRARMVAASDNLDYDRDEPAIVVRRGHVLKAGPSCFLNNQGNPMSIAKPRRLLSIEYATSTIGIQHVQDELNRVI